MVLPTWWMPNVHSPTPNPNPLQEPLPRLVLRALCWRQEKHRRAPGEGLVRRVSLGSARRGGSPLPGAGLGLAARRHVLAPWGRSPPEGSWFTQRFPSGCVGSVCSGRCAAVGGGRSATAWDCLWHRSPLLSRAERGQWPLSGQGRRFLPGGPRLAGGETRAGSSSGQPRWHEAASSELTGLGLGSCSPVTTGAGTVSPDLGAAGLQLRARPAHTGGCRVHSTQPAGFHEFSLRCHRHRWGCAPAWPASRSR